MKPGEGPKGTNLYRIVLPTPEAGYTPEESFTLKRTSSTPEAGFLKPLKPTSDKPSRNRHEPLIADGFASFWSVYPKKVGKGEAEKAWKRAKVNGHFEEVMSALAKQKQSDQWARNNGQYIPNPATWINQRRWEDDLATPNQEASHDWF